MQLTYTPLLQKQRDLYDLPRGFERFREYLNELVGPDGDMEFPLGYLNPMGKDHVPARLDAYLKQDAEASAARATREAAERLAFFGSERDIPDFRVSLVLADDAAGGWTRRESTEADHHYFQAGEQRRGWITALLWTGDDPAHVRPDLETRAAIFRVATILRMGRAPRTIGEIALVESLSGLFAGAPDAHERGEPSASEDATQFNAAIHERARAALIQNATNEDYPTWFALWFGDQAARDLGYTPAGLPPGALRTVAREIVSEYLDGRAVAPEDLLRETAEEPDTAARSIFRE